MSRIEAATDEGTRDFMARGSCVSTGNPEQWYPEQGGRGTAKMAVRICRGCDVRIECLTYALDHEADQWGIWGGLTAKERAALRAPVPHSRPVTVQRHSPAQQPATTTSLHASTATTRPAAATEPAA